MKFVTGFFVMVQIKIVPCKVTYGTLLDAHQGRSPRSTCGE